MKLEIWASRKPNQPPKWYWHVLARNGHKLAWSGEDYKRRTTMIKILKKLFPQAFDGSNKMAFSELR